jgi:hypothetical protein
MMVPKHWRKPQGELNAFMINIKGGQLSKKLGKTRRKARWNRGRGGLSHHSSEIIPRDNRLLKNPK